MAQTPQHTVHSIYSDDVDSVQLEMECGGVQKWVVVFSRALGPGNLAVSFFSGALGMGEALNGA